MNTLALPQFFVSVASKGLKFCVSGLESTFTGGPASVDSKGSYVASNPAEEAPFSLVFRVPKRQGTATGTDGHGGITQVYPAASVPGC